MNGFEIYEVCEVQSGDATILPWILEMLTQT